MKGYFGLIAAAWLSAGLLAAERFVQVKATADSAAPGYEAWRAMDGDPATIWHTQFGDKNPALPHQLDIDLGAVYPITGFRYLARQDGENGAIQDFELFLSDEGSNFGAPVAQGRLPRTNAWVRVTFSIPQTARHVRLRALSEAGGRPWTSIAELRILSSGIEFRAATGQALRMPWRDEPPATETEWQYAGLWRDIRNRGRFEAIASQTLRSASLILPGDRDPVDVILRRTRALLDDLSSQLDADLAARFSARLNRFGMDAAAIDVDEPQRRFVLFERVGALRREIAFSNPLLNFKELLFAKRHRAIYNHMCDQYYGIAARPGGGLFVLSDPFGPSPAVRDLLAEAKVENGRLAGQKLAGGPNKPYKLFYDGEGKLSGDQTEGGAFLSPEVSFDGKTILFAYVECSGGREHRHHTDPARGHWDEGRAYHIYKVDADGTGLRQMTDGTWNDFSPAWLPNGRIAFISERRGGYLRCGRVCPTFTLFDMAADGSDINCLSVHETNEWDPSVTHDGRIIWTRWDYVDRHGCTAHAPWITTLDGRDPRPVHGNYAPRSSRPDMELNVRAIPGSARYMATAAPHHGQAFGSIVMIDPEIADDDGMAPVKRLTPDVDFPETQNGAETYGMAWPLSQDYFLCVYDARMPAGNHDGQHLRQFNSNYGIYLVDTFGNKELIYRDPEISCGWPMPLRARPVPAAPVLASGEARVNPAEPRTGEPAEEATVTVLNVYNSLLPWPEGTKITALRVLQVLPMTVPSGAPPHETGMRIASAGDSVVPVRHVLGTAPVHEDGSAHFVAPANRELFFQAIDERGMAVQSMRSATALRAGERMTCVGCHAPSQHSPAPSATVPLALRQPPARLQPDVDGSNPFSYPRLVQPVLDRKCVACHVEKNAPNLARDPISRNWFASYHTLMPRFGFFDYGDSYRTTPGKFGAHASKLISLLEAGHYDVKLTDDEFHRLTLWLDCSSIFYGVYEREGGLAQLRGDLAKPTLE